MQGLFGTPHTHVGINSAAMKDQELLLEEDIEVGAGAELLGNLTA
jgi:hypothetical protein